MGAKVRICVLYNYSLLWPIFQDACTLTTCNICRYILPYSTESGSRYHAARTIQVYWPTLGQQDQGCQETL